MHKMYNSHLLNIQEGYRFPNYYIQILYYIFFKKGPNRLKYPQIIIPIDLMKKKQKKKKKKKKPDHLLR